MTDSVLSETVKPVSLLNLNIGREQAPGKGVRDLVGTARELRVLLLWFQILAQFYGTIWSH